MASLCCIWCWYLRQRAPRRPDVVEQSLCTQRFVLCYHLTSQHLISISFSGSRISLPKLPSTSGTRPLKSCSDNSIVSQYTLALNSKFFHSLLTKNQPANLRSLIYSICSSTFAEIIRQISSSSTIHKNIRW